MENTAEAWNDITLESAEFVLEQAEKRLQATIDIEKSLTDRAVNIMQFSIPLSVALIGLVAAEPRKELLWFYVIVLTFSLMISYMCLHVYDGHILIYPGQKPTIMLAGQNFMSRDEDHGITMIIRCALSMERATEINDRRNRERQSVLFWSLVFLKSLLLSSPFVFAMGLLILKNHSECCMASAVVNFCEA